MTKALHACLDSYPSNPTTVTAKKKHPFMLEIPASDRGTTARDRKGRCDMFRYFQWPRQFPSPAREGSPKCRFGALRLKASIVTKLLELTAVLRAVADFG